ncbi:hypothetical protein D3C79_853560 [compost metagenome]
MDQLLDAPLIGACRRPALGRRRSGDFVELTVLEEQPQARLDQRLEHAPQLLRRALGLIDGGPDFGFDLAQTVRTDCLADGLLGLEKLVDIGFGKTDSLGQIGDRRLLVAIEAEVFGGRGHDLVAYLVIDRTT